MRTKLRLTSLLLILCCTALAAQRSLEELRAQAATARPEDLPKIYKSILEQEIGNIEQLYRSGDSAKGATAVEQLTADCIAASEASRKTRKHMKQTEITLRKIGERLDELERDAAFDDRPSIKTALERVEQTRSSLLEAMFAK